MQAPGERESTADLASGAGQNWLGNSAWQAPQVEISGIKSWASITAMSYYRGEGEYVWRGGPPPDSAHTGSAFADALAGRAGTYLGNTAH